MLLEISTVPSGFKFFYQLAVLFSLSRVATEIRMTKLMYGKNRYRRLRRTTIVFFLEFIEEIFVDDSCIVGRMFIEYFVIFSISSLFIKLKEISYRFCIERTANRTIVAFVTCFHLHIQLFFCLSKINSNEDLNNVDKYIDI